MKKRNCFRIARLNRQNGKTPEVLKKLSWDKLLSPGAMMCR
jgi:hypothetical protein